MSSNWQIQSDIQTQLLKSGLYGRTDAGYLNNKDNEDKAWDAAQSLMSNGITNADQVNRYISARNNTDPSSGNWTSSGSLTKDALSYVKGGAEGWARDIYKETFDGREPTTAEINDIISWAGGNNKTEAAKAFKQDPLSVSQNIVDADVKARGEIKAAKNVSDRAFMTDSLQNPYFNKDTGIVSGQSKLLEQVLTESEDESLRKLKDNLASMGILESGSLGAGSTDIGKQKLKEMNKGQTQFETQAQSDILTQAMDYANNSATWTDEQRKAGLANIAERIAQEYNDKQAKQYAETVAKSQASPWSSILNAGATVGSILFPPAAPWLMGANAVGQAGLSMGQIGAGQTSSNSNAFGEALDARPKAWGNTYGLGLRFSAS